MTVTPEQIEAARDVLEKLRREVIDPIWEKVFPYSLMGGAVKTWFDQETGTLHAEKVDVELPEKPPLPPNSKSHG